MLDDPVLGQLLLLIWNFPVHFSAKSTDKLYSYILTVDSVVHLPAVGISKAHPKVPGQIYALPKEGNLIPVLLQPKVEDGVEVVQPTAMESPKV